MKRPVFTFFLYATLISCCRLAHPFPRIVAVRQHLDLPFCLKNIKFVIFPRSFSCPPLSLHMNPNILYKFINFNNFPSPHILKNIFTNVEFIGLHLYGENLTKY